MDAGKATEGLTAIASTGKKHYIWLAVLLLVGLVLAIRYRNEIGQALGKIHPTIAKLLNVTVATAVVIFGLCFGSEVAQAATCCAKPLAHAVASTSGGFFDWLASAWSTIAAAGAGVTLCSVVGFPAPDIIEDKVSKGNKSYLFEPGAAQSVDFETDAESSKKPDKRPLVALDKVIELTTTIRTVNGGAAIKDEELPRLITSVKMHGDPIGTILDADVGTGPILKHYAEFMGLGFNRGPDFPVATISLPQSPSTTNDATYTRVLTIPFAQRWYQRPIDTAIPLCLLSNVTTTVKLPASTVFGGISTGATYRGAGSMLRVYTNVVPNTHWYWPLINQHILETPSGGTKRVTLARFGEKNAAGTEPVDLVHTISLLSNKLGLGGNQSLENILSIQSEKLGIIDMENVGAFFANRVMAQRVGASPLLIEDNANFVQDAVSDGYNLEDGKFLNLLQPSMGMGFESLKRWARGSGYELPIDMTCTATPSDKHAFVISSLRYLSQNIADQVVKLSGGKLTKDRGARIPA